ncbi:uncharacterized protein EKO05_0003685 [Ascochyta rabiei]|uniref:Uncharacterized protein n=1 Tax=Didymella rabiei TaxID=5454 RepID=A0A162YUT2_DIDRA|nr:uncharacterized protein EKO05_0003685 [Ascochyta rabiei]KZM20238.1 hypothetical protein ST47_g8583 [Ascochyta rabiei]UPX13159.1 hypothetical protein EKO05_0003685 [Ascochyta rabiei]
MATDITKTGQYQVMDPDEVIVGFEGLIKVMHVLYGPNFVGANFSPKCCNVRTGEKMEKNVHHCTHNDIQGHAITKQCFLKGHQSYCCEWMEIDGHRVRCGVRLKVESGGCGTHRSKLMEHSNNLLLKNLIAGKLDSITWRQLSDPVKMAQNEANAAQGRVMNDTKLTILAQHSEKIEELDAVGFLPQADHRTYSIHIAFNENKIQRDRTAVEERRLRAAERKSGLTVNLKRAASNIKEAMTSEHPNRKTAEVEKKGLQASSRVKKCSRPDPSVFKNKRGGKKVSDLPS